MRRKMSNIRNDEKMRESVPGALLKECLVCGSLVAGSATFLRVRYGEVSLRKTGAAGFHHNDGNCRVSVE
jgi:hypothetical protein